MMCSELLALADFSLVGGICAQSFPSKQRATELSFGRRTSRNWKAQQVKGGRITEIQREILSHLLPQEISGLQHNNFQYHLLY